MDRTSRRRFLGALGVTGGAAAVTACTGDSGDADDTAGGGDHATPTTPPADRRPPPPVPADPGIPGDPFTLGVASGDPLPDAVVLWARLAPDPGADDGGMPEGDHDVLWEVAEDDAFAAPAATGIARADQAAAHTVHVDASGLEPGSWYHYRFRIGRWTSPVGRTRTAPAPGDDDPLAIGVASCQRFQDGWYNAWADVSRSGLDLVVFLGDYIYEYPAEPVDPAGGVVRPLGPDPGEPECTSLADYRRRYAIHRSDEHLRAAHAAAPWVAVWDDHEVDDNYAGLVPAQGAEGFTGRRAAAYRAWWEHMPVRLPPPDGPDLTMHRRVDWGTVASIFLLDGRQHRDDQACGDATLDLSPACEQAGDPERSMLGADQEEWLSQGLATSRAAWNLLANQTVMAPVVVGDAVLNYDQWDGYPAARERLLSAVDEAGLTNTVVLSGDLHLAGVAELRLGDGPEAPAVATELVATSISSEPAVPADLAEAVPGLLGWVRYLDTRRGWTRCSLDRSELVAEYRVVEDNTVRGAPLRTDATFRITPDRPGATAV